jgi:hypothetical protein
LSELAIGLVRHACQYAHQTVHCQGPTVATTRSGLERIGNEMTPELLTATMAMLVFIGSFVVLSLAAFAFGVDSRPFIDDRGPHGWIGS